jgi:acyl-CoA oxidase
MFLPALKNLGTPEQQEKWVTLAEKYQIIGTYAQTEMGHGTFIRGLETTATYDPKTKEFVIHSPKISSYKWWPGGLGHTANHAVIFAQLYSLGKCHGIHPFIVQLRDVETHKPLKGIIVGEIGSKLGFNSANNGFLGFDNYRIPLNQMLMKNSEITESGEYKKKQSSILAYGTMTRVRVGIVRDSAIFLSKAVTIATRYSMVRRQSPINPNEPEPRIIEHVTQQQKIFPMITKSLGIKIASENLIKIYLNLLSDLEKGELERLPELHALSCCLKAVCTNEATAGIHSLRLACGGHGYLNSSGLNNIFVHATAAQTYEGENTILLLQTARYLMKAWKQALNGEKLPPTVAYLTKYTKISGKQKFDGSVEGILRMMEATAAHFISKAFNQMEARKKYDTVESAANKTGVELVKAAEIHCQLFLLTSMIEHQKKQGKMSKNIYSLMQDVSELFTVELIIRLLGDIMQVNDLTTKDINDLQNRFENALTKLRPNAIGIVDGFHYSDFVLNSTIGAYDGNVYERLLDAAKQSPLNQEDVNKSFEMYLKPFMKSNL